MGLIRLVPSFPILNEWILELLKTFKPIAVTLRDASGATLQFTNTGCSMELARVTESHLNLRLALNDVPSMWNADLLSLILPKRGFNTVHGGVGACDQPKLGNDGGFGFNTCAKVPHPCPFMAATTPNTDELYCKNRNETTGLRESCYFGYEDMGESGTIVTNTDCCNDLGGRELCPPNYPVMCESQDCAGDYCCEATVDDCKKFYGTGARKCSKPGPPGPIKCNVEDYDSCPENMYCDTCKDDMCTKSGMEGICKDPNPLSG